MRFDVAGLSFDWIQGWASLPKTPSARENGRTHGVAVAGDGRVVVFRQADPAVVVLDPNGDTISAWGDRFGGAHGLTLVEEGGEERLWVTDEMSGEVSKLSMAGETLLRLEVPDVQVYQDGRYAPTWVAVDERRLGGNGDVWVADGYGMNLVHRFDESGRYCESLDGTEGGAGAFDCPHGVWIDRRRAEPELYVADRGNRRLQVYGLDGRFKRTAGEGALECPCVGLVYGDALIVPELCARLAVLDGDDQCVGYLGENQQACAHPQWPDLPPSHISEGLFNSPHSAASDKEGNLYIVEWIVGGRLTKLARL